MVAQPVFTVPKKGSAKLHLVNDHSAGSKSLNSLIPAKGRFDVLDNLSDLGANIWETLCWTPELQLNFLWKSNTSQPYRCLPMHPQWQAQQVTFIDVTYHID